MKRREALQELHLALEGAVDQMARAQRLCVGGGHDIEGLDARIDLAFAEIVALRNQVRDDLMNELAKPPEPPTIRLRK